jgi:hypothetical protein
MEKAQLHIDSIVRDTDRMLRIGPIDEKKSEKRDKLDLLLELLEATSEPTKKTHLIYRLRINYYQLTRYLDLLLKLEMVEATCVKTPRIVQQNVDLQLRAR